MKNYKGNIVDNQNFYTKNAVAVINKPTGMNSMTCVKKVKAILSVNKAGHLGTLDPLASGVLVVALNKATKLFESHLKDVKTYRAVFKFGLQTTTFDSEGEIEIRENVDIKKQNVENILKYLIGSYEQMPPAYSAKKIGGKKAYELARAGKEVNLKTKLVTIFEFKLLDELEKNTFLFEIKCSSGTYIRSLARDLAKELGTVGVMVGLVRTSAGEYNLEHAVTLEQLKQENLIEVEI